MRGMLVIAVGVMAAGVFAQGTVSLVPAAPAEAQAAFFGASTEYNIILKDKAGAEITAMPFALANTTLSNDFIVELPEVFGQRSNGRNNAAWYVTPMVHADAVAFQRWVGFDIPQNDLPRVASVSIELAE